ncbi:CDP-diacylglycerol--serine O-phosphatidyltransferase [Frischella sp. Ac13]|uniref:CDP-diacylglycerol--serine O-phosphatidyltransferase n=1 Tax=Frischella japonica TaxID=2741544 RepID=A0ABR7QYI6_9GAMM|nr:CDP-diacylglycerol--serine O-phosphatidyltransferase [Frischella japonica]MBC9131269.1 CDP-diacylglycerol--serine O-phosphatidyltransferase [Frischella japonica]
MRIPFIKYNHQKYLNELVKLEQQPENYQILATPNEYRQTLLNAIKCAQKRIYIIALYLERDEAGQEILQAIYEAKRNNPQLDVKIFVDWHRAQRGRIGEGMADTNAHFYHQLKQQNPEIDVAIYGVPVNRREVLGVLHLKGSIIDDTLLYTGASINNVYLHKLDKYRYDRYHIITNPILADSMVTFIDQQFLTYEAVQRLDSDNLKTRKQLKSAIKVFRHHLAQANYQFKGDSLNSSLSVTPIVGLGKSNQLNQVIHHLILSANEKIVFCTPYFNLPQIIIKDIIRQLRKGKKVEIIVGDKTANDFYIPEDQPFNIIGGLPYLYEVNLRQFIERLQPYIDKEQLIIRLWKDEDNSYHLKGIWVDDEWVLITGNNINPRAWRLDLENGILVHDPKQQLYSQFRQELQQIRVKTLLVNHFQQIQASQFYPIQVQKLINRLGRIQIDRIIKRLL